MLSLACRSFIKGKSVVHHNRIPAKRPLHQPVDFNRKKQNGVLILEDGSCFNGVSFGSVKATTGEVVFTTGMVGYTESLTDPSYCEQILTFTYPLLGNYGIPNRTVDHHGLLKAFESTKIHPNGIVCAEYSDNFSHWNASESLSQWMQRENIPGLTGVDTRALVQKLRDKSVMLGKIIFDQDVDLSDPFKANLVAKVSVKEPITFGNPKAPIKIILVDCGVKHHMIRCLLEAGEGNAHVKVVPWDYDFNKEPFDGLFISNGPGDPRYVPETVANISKAYQGNKPIFGICMGNQLMALAAGASVYKLPFGNRGQNQPVIDTTNRKLYITPQNHGYAVDNNSLPADWLPAFINANDGSNEGIMHRRKPFFSVQFHPEARSGPGDTKFMFSKFMDLIKAARAKQPMVHLQTREFPKKVLILGSGALQIGQAGEFDYSGSQAIKALKEEGIKVILINPNIATVMTAKGIADEVYFQPVTVSSIEEVIKKERPDGIFLGFGGQTALNTGLELHKQGILTKYGLRVYGTSVKSIEIAEDRELFKQALLEINEPVAPSISAVTVQQAVTAAEKIGYPVIVRAAFALGGLGSGFADDPASLKVLVEKALSVSPQVLVEKSVKGWKEVEYEVVRDKEDNCITVCNMENFDPMGIHTGESIVVAPSQTLSNEEYHMLRESAIRIIRHLEIVGECNVQYCLDPISLQYYVIEVNPRLSRSSALASKATGYPLAFVAAKLSLGIPLNEVRNSVTQVTSACFEPSLDYIVTKMPRWDLSKFARVIPQISSQMKSVGEVMAVGRCFEESIQKAIRLVNTSGNIGFEPKPGKISDLNDELTRPTPMRIFALAEAFQKGYTVDAIFDLTKIDPWYLQKLANIWNLRVELQTKYTSVTQIPSQQLRLAKQMGFSDLQIAKLFNEEEMKVRAYRKSLKIVPVVKQIDTLAAEFPAKTNYLYMTYHDYKNDIPANSRPFIILGSGTYRIGSSVEFDYCAVTAARELRKLGKKVAMINYNPETVSTDYDESDRLYFEELTLERVLDICDFETPEKVVVSMGGQEAQNLSVPLSEQQVPIAGTPTSSIDRAEDRYKFSKMCDEIGVTQPLWKELTTKIEASKFADRVGFPVLVRPSYVLSGAAMKVAWSNEELIAFLDAAVEVSPKYPVVITQFILGAKEIELDAVAHNGQLINWAISEHIENAGVHSGDATMVLPAHTLTEENKETVKAIGTKIAQALEISGPMNVQFLFKDGQFSVIECNLRASRSFPYVSKTYDINFIETATKVFIGDEVKPNPRCDQALKHYCVKAPQFSFMRIHGSDPVLGVEMGSTGEVACFGANPYEAFLKSITSVHNGFRMPKLKKVLISGAIPESFTQQIGILQQNLGFTVFLTTEASKTFKTVKNVTHLTREEAIAKIMAKSLDFVVNIPQVGLGSQNDNENYLVRRSSVDFNIPIIVNLQIAEFLVAALAAKTVVTTKSYSQYIKAFEEL